MKIINCEQYSDEWWQVRCGVPTASCADKLITPKQWKPSASQADYIAELIGEQYDPAYGPRDDYQTSAMRNGTVIEPEARAFFAFHTGEDVAQTGFVLTDDRRWGCSPDGLVGDSAGLELKGPTHKVHTSYLLADEVPSDYLPQIHFSMVVTGFRKWYFMSYARNMRPLLKVVEWDDKTDAMAAVMEDFWKKYQDALSKIQAMDLPVEAVAEPEEEVVLF